MTLVVVESSSIQAIDYHKADKCLDVYFKDGKQIQYLQVPERVYKEFLESESVGRYFNFNIRNKYKFRGM
jgi:lysyl-tRNA synthetase class 2